MLIFVESQRKPEGLLSVILSFMTAIQSRHYATKDVIDVYSRSHSISLATKMNALYIIIVETFKQQSLMASSTLTFFYWMKVLMTVKSIMNTTKISNHVYYFKIHYNEHYNAMPLAACGIYFLLLIFSRLTRRIMTDWSRLLIGLYSRFKYLWCT